MTAKLKVGLHKCTPQGFHSKKRKFFRHSFFFSIYYFLLQLSYLTLKNNTFIYGMSKCHEENRRAEKISKVR
jgi:hypothetical protein